MLSEQINLFENLRANHSSLGKSFEKELERTHHFYKIKNLAKIEKNLVEWRYISKGEFDRLAKTPGLLANLSTGGVCSEYSRTLISAAELAENQLRLTLKRQRVNLFL